MKKRSSIILLLLLLLASAANASAWRSSTGNIFRFQSNGTYTVLMTNGGTVSGRWWWVRPGVKFEYQEYGYTGTSFVYINGNQATVCDYYDRPSSYWTFLSARGASEDNEIDETSWFAPVPVTPEPGKS